MLTRTSCRINAGHYTALVKTSGKWWLANDHKVREMSEEEVAKRRDGYLFFLRRK
ncbi:hypothetical protein L228DRAFT_245090 [Xylona heveae TC161]|uniref:USP domain-containing protein n=1 Tax=Xylona heveae (strain CBS 132557 / TC161) TaxID=1328760 RepID=A0A165I0L7_XYLHT|nr:hypothetical protein L228DRAFT_245090 [Xylona heveae TC161]KZF24191.1 hypothetical protein L228DRAFT_245090 [Xylona heveae TC161]